MLLECLSGCCICFTHMLKIFYVDVVYVCNGFKCFFSGVFASVSDACFKCFICLRMHVVNVLSGCLKNRSDVAAVDPPPQPSAATTGKRMSGS